MSRASDILARIKEEHIAFVDFRFTDPRGTWHHISYAASALDQDLLTDGIMFDGSSIAGWQGIEVSDMKLSPDLNTACLDPFFAEPTLVIVCNILDPTTDEPYERDPRGTALKAVNHLKMTGIGDQVFVGPEAEFFVFDDVRYKTDPYNTSFKLDAEELAKNDDRKYETGNLGDHIRMKHGYFPTPPLDSAQDLRSEMIGAMLKMGLKAEKHHHEVGSAQHELGMAFDELVRMGDQQQIYKYCIRQTAFAYGKSATFMPKPVFGDNGSGMHCHLSIWKDAQPVFAGSNYADLSMDCLYFIGGIIKHARAVNAFTNPSTNSYKRLVPGFEAPVLLAYSSRNRSASCRIPMASSPKAKRVEVRFPDPSANPYLAFSALLMAGLDGIQNKIHPGDPMDKNLYDLPPEELKDVPSVATSLSQALDALEADHAFLTEGGVFTKEQIEAYVDLKREEVVRMDQTPHPVEFELYYSC